MRTNTLLAIAVALVLPACGKLKPAAKEKVTAVPSGDYAVAVAPVDAPAAFADLGISARSGAVTGEVAGAKPGSAVTVAVPLTAGAPAATASTHLCVVLLGDDTKLYVWLEAAIATATDTKVEVATTLFGTFQAFDCADGDLAGVIQMNKDGTSTGLTNPHAEIITQTSSSVTLALSSMSAATTRIVAAYEDVGLPDDCATEKAGVDTAGQATITFTVAGIGAGQRVLRLCAKGADGRLSTGTKISIDLTLTDPSFTVKSKISDAFTLALVAASADTTSFQVAQAPGTLPPVSCTTEDIQSIAVDASGKTDLTFSGITAGVHAFRICAVDGSGNHSAGVTGTVTLEMPDPGAATVTSQTSSSVTISLTAGAELPAKYRVAEQQGTTAPADCASNDSQEVGPGNDGSGVVVFTGLAAGLHAFIACTVDSVTNHSTGITGTFTLTMPPPASATAAQQTATSFTVHVTPGTETPAHYQVAMVIGATAPATCGGDTTQTVVADATNGDALVTFSSLTSGQLYSYRACTIDGAGNRSTGVTGSVSL